MVIGNFLVIVDDLDFPRIAIPPLEPDTPLIVDTNAVSAGSIR
jgi:hypothetical protein